MNGEYLSYYPQFESNQVLTSAHLNELRQYLDEQIRLTRSQLIGVGVCAGLTFKAMKPTDTEKSLDKSLAFDFGIRVFAGFGVSSEGFFISIEGEKALPELPTEDPYRSTRYSDYVKYRKYVDQSPDLYWHVGKESNPKQIAITELLTVRDAEQLILDGVPKNTIHDLTETQVKDKVLVLYLELQDISLRSCVGKDCDNKGSKRHITPRILLIERDAKAGIDGTTKPAEIVVTSLDGLIMRQPYPKQMRAPRLIAGLQAKGTPLQSILSYPELGEGYLAAIDQWQNNLATEIANSHERYSPFLGLTDKDLDQITALKSMVFPSSHAQYGLDLLKDLTRALNEFNLLAYELKRDVCNEGYIFPRHLMLGTVPHDLIYNSGHYDRYRNYFIQFGLTPAQDRKLRQAQILFVRMLQQIKHYLQFPSNNFDADGEVRMVPSQEDEYSVGQGTIPDYYKVSQPLAQSWDPDRYLNGLHDEVLSFEPGTYSTKPHVLMPFCYDIDDKPFLRVQNLIGRQVEESLDAITESMVKNNLAFDVVPVKLGKELSLKDLKEFISNMPEWVQLESQFHSQRAALHALVANLRGFIRAHDIKDLQKGIALPMDLVQRYMDQTPVMENVLYALGTGSLLDFISKDGISTMVKGFIPNFAADGLSDLYQYMYSELRTFAQYLMLLLNHQRDVQLRQTPDPCDLTDRHAFQLEVDQALVTLSNFLDNRLWVQFQSLIQQAQGYLEAIQSHSPRLFHNFAKLHPGIEHLGGTYKGGTYVLVYEDQFKLLDFPDGGILTEGGAEDLVFRSEFDMFAIFDDEEAGGEILMDASFAPELENKELKSFLVKLLDAMTTDGLQSNEQLGLRSSKAENIFPNYIAILEKREGELGKEKVTSLASSLILLLDKAIGDATETVQGLIPTYAQYLSEAYNVDLEELGVSFKGITVESGPLVTKEELMRLSGLLVDILERMDDGFLGPDDFAELRGQSPGEVWESYLSKAAAAMDRDVTPKLRESFTLKCLEILGTVDGKVLADREIQPLIWEMYKESISKGSEFLPPKESDGQAAFKDFLLESLIHYGKLILSESGLEALRRSSVPDLWGTYLSLYAKSTGERFLDMDVQRSLLDGFLELMEKADPDRSRRENWEDDLSDYILALRNERQRIASADMDAKPADPDLVRILVEVLGETIKSPEGKRILVISGSVPELDFLKSITLDALWPTFEARLERQFKELRPDALDRLKTEYHNNLLIAVQKGLGFESGFTEDIRKYANYLAIAGPGENPFMRRAILDILQEMGGKLFAPEVMEDIASLSATMMWPTFLRSLLQIQGKPGNLAAAQKAQDSFVQSMMKMDVEKLRDQGIDVEWFRYTASLMAPIKEQPDYMGQVVQMALEAMMKVESHGISDEMGGQLLTLQPDALLPAYLDAVLDSDDQPLQPKEKFGLRKKVIQQIQETKVPVGSPKELVMLWGIYQDSFAPELPGPSLKKVIVADFALPYPAKESLDRLSAKQRPAHRPLFVLQGDTAIVTPGASVDIRILDNDDFAINTPAEQSSNLKVAIMSVVHAPGALGGVATLIADPKIVLPGAPQNVLRYEAFFGIPLEGGEISEITYQVTDTVSGQSALGKVLILTRQPLGLISEPCCCCKDYTFMVTQGETLKIVEPFLAFADRAPYVFRLLKEDGSETSSLSTPEFSATLLKSSLSVNTSLLFEGTIRLPYRVRYEGGKAHCEGMITVIVTCRCLQMPCEVTLAVTAGETAEARNVLSMEERQEGLQVRLKNELGNPVDVLNAPFPQIISVQTGPFDADFPSTVLAVKTDGLTSTSALVPFFKGVVEGDNFVIHGECTLVILVNPTQPPCKQEYDIFADIETTLHKVLTSDEAAQGMELRFDHNGAPVMNLVSMPAGLISASIVTVTGSADPYQAFKVRPFPGFSGTVEFMFYKGKSEGGEIFKLTSICTMVLHVWPPVNNADQYTIMENETLVIYDLLSPTEIESDLRLRFPQGGGGSVNTELYSYSLRLADTGTGNTSIQVLPEGAASLELIAVPPKGAADTGFLLQPILGYNGLITWEYEVYLLGGISSDAVSSGTIEVTVIPVNDFSFTYDVKPNELFTSFNLVTEKEIFDGWEVRFFDGAKFTNSLPLQTGTKLLELTKDESSNVVGWTFQSAPEFDGDVVFRIGVVELRDGYLIGHRIYTITMRVRPGLGEGPFLYTANVTADGSFSFGDIIDASDMKNGMTLLRFMDKSGGPSMVIPDMPNGLLDAFLTSGGLSQTSESALKVTTSSTSEGLAITIPMFKGALGFNGFLPMNTGQVVLNVSGSAEAPFVRTVQAVPGQPVFIADILTEKEQNNGVQLRFVGKSELPSVEVNPPNGLNVLRLYPSEATGAPNCLILLSADGKYYNQLTIPMYKVILGQFGDEVINTGQLIVNIAYGVPFPSFAETRVVQVDTKTMIDDLFSPYDKENGIDQLHFKWSDEKASDQAEFLPAGLTGLVIQDTPDSKFGLVGLRADGSQSYIQIALYKGFLYQSDFIPMAAGILSLNIQKEGSLPNFEILRTVVVGEKVDLVDLITEQDLKNDIFQLSFMDGNGKPTPGYYDYHLDFIFLTPMGPREIPNSAIQLLAVQIGTVVIPLLKGNDTPDGFQPAAIGQLVLDIQENQKGTLPNYNFDLNFGQSPYYNLGEYEQYQSQFLLNEVQSIIENNAKDPNAAGYQILGSYQYTYQQNIEYLRYRIERAPFNSPEQEYYLRIFSLTVDSLIEVTKFIGDVSNWGGLDSLYFSITDTVSLLRNYGLLDQPVGAVFKNMLQYKFIPQTAPMLAYYVSTWSPPTF